VCLGDNPEPEGVDRVLADEEEGSRGATAHLVALGARRIAMIRGPRGSAPGRLAGYRRALAEAGVAYDSNLVVEGAWTEESGRAAMETLIRRTPRPDGIFCANDLMAIGAMSVLRRLPVDVPGEIALVGFDDIRAASLLTPSLTTVENPAYETGQRAGELLLGRMQGAYAGPPRTVVIPCRLVVRESA
jgi:LacI family transcriptional regulator